jgi:hypothetical protein
VVEGYGKVLAGVVQGLGQVCEKFGIIFLTFASGTTIIRHMVQLIVVAYSGLISIPAVIRP